MRGTGRHKAVRVAVGRQEDDIDEAIAPLIEEIWKAEIWTVDACEDSRPRRGLDEPWVWVEFMTAQDAEHFLNIVASATEPLGPLHERMRLGAYSLEEARRGCWFYGADVVDFSVEEVVDERTEEGEFRHNPPMEFVFHISIQFPRADLASVVDALRRHNLQPSS